MLLIRKHETFKTEIGFEVVLNFYSPMNLEKPFFFIKENISESEFNLLNEKPNETQVFEFNARLDLLSDSDGNIIDKVEQGIENIEFSKASALFNLLKTD